MYADWAPTLYKCMLSEWLCVHVLLRGVDSVLPCSGLAVWGMYLWLLVVVDNKIIGCTCQ